MRLQIYSDLHLEFYRDGGKQVLDNLFSVKPDNVDALLLAGDLTCLGAIPWEVVYHQFGRICEQYPRVFYVPGNHEFYRTNPLAGMEFLRQFEYESNNFTLMEPGHKSFFLGYTLIGATLWFPYIRDNEKHYHGINDFSSIGDPFPEWAYDHYNEFSRYLSANLDSNSIVVTHHLPSYLSVHPRYAGSPLNRFFVGNVEDLIIEKQPVLWVHGHTHTCSDYKIGSTRVVCNPMGYSGGENLHFNPSLVIEL